MGGGAPVGEVMAFAGSVLPDGYLKCNGATFDAAAYPELNTLLGSNVLPDMRGEFLRGWDDGRGVDSGRGLLGFQSGQNASHSHTHTDNYVNNVSTPNRNINKSENGWLYVSFVGSTNTTRTTSTSGGSEARPRNIAVLYIIKAIP
ncbi:MAG: tail fiber protein [Cohaesibacteraceae bacterium]|nr:tail fiber protein [Cohaesibacteraceae bacterium]MBL4876725.1 tail fiber protein [Cohaesibacteraceae bacterium]